MANLLKQRTINRVILINTDSIYPNINQPRKIFDIKELQDLAISIDANGMLQPITVRRIDKGYEIIAGERRLRAAKLANLRAVPCIVMNVSDKQSALFALLENLQRSNLNYFEESLALKSLIVEWSMSQTELGERLGKAQSTIANKLRLLYFDDETQELFINNGISERQARALLKVSDSTKIPDAVEYISKNKLSCLQTERYIEAIESSRTAPKKVFKPIFRDVKIFLNTINNAVKLMNDSGINAVAQKIECENYIEYVVRIPLDTPLNNMPTNPNMLLKP